MTGKLRTERKSYKEKETLALNLEEKMNLFFQKMREKSTLGIKKK